MCNFTNNATFQMGNASFNGGTFTGHLTNHGTFNYYQGHAWISGGYLIVHAVVDRILDSAIGHFSNSSSAGRKFESCTGHYAEHLAISPRRFSFCSTSSRSCGTVACARSAPVTVGIGWTDQSQGARVRPSGSCGQLRVHVRRLQPQRKTDRPVHQQEPRPQYQERQRVRQHQ